MSDHFVIIMAIAGIWVFFGGGAIGFLVARELGSRKIPIKEADHLRLQARNAELLQRNLELQSTQATLMELNDTLTQGIQTLAIEVQRLKEEKDV